jgi:hypothetical protein
MPRIGVLTGLDEAEAKRRVGPFLQELQRLGWIDGRNIRIDKRVGAGKADAMRAWAREIFDKTGAERIGNEREDNRHGGPAQALPIPLHICGNVTGFMLFESTSW